LLFVLDRVSPRLALNLQSPASVSLVLGMNTLFEVVFLMIFLHHFISFINLIKNSKLSRVFVCLSACVFIRIS
jgi:hypothetical protein